MYTVEIILGHVFAANVYGECVDVTMAITDFDIYT